MAWYQLYFQFEEVAEARVQYNDWAELRELTPGYKDIERAIANLSRPGALTATLNWYRANLAPHLPGPPPELHRRSHARLRRLRPGALALRGDPRRHPLDPARRTGTP
jgi:hypothetical protein